jgi:cytochrome P450
MTVAERGVLPRFDPQAPDVRHDPYPTYARLREAGALARGGPGQYYVTRAADVVRLLREDRLSNVIPPAYLRYALGEGPAAELLQRVLLHHDDPHHAAIRSAMSVAFSRSATAALGPAVDRTVAGMLDAMEGRGGFDAVQDLAVPLPLAVICELLGAPAADQVEIRPRALDLSKAFAPLVSGPDRLAADAAVDWMRHYVTGLLAARRRTPGSDVLSAMQAAAAARRLTIAELVDNAVFLFFAGFETTTNLLATGCAALLDHPAQCHRLVQDPALVPSMVEETLRFDAPIQSRARCVVEPVEVGGRRLRPGRVAILLLGSANRDPAAFEAPDRFDVGRRPNAHLGFGSGLHHCLGARLARLEAVTAFRELLARFGTLEAAGPAQRDPHSAFRAYASVPVRVAPWRPRRR